MALSYLYWIPDTLFMVFPAAVLFATVFSIGTFSRHHEITAAKASGISFYRFVAPVEVTRHPAPPGESVGGGDPLAAYRAWAEGRLRLESLSRDALPGAI